MIPVLPQQPDGNELLDGPGGAQLGEEFFRLGHLQLARGDVGGASAAWVMRSVGRALL